MTHHLRFRQIHLDFHTSKDIPGIGAAFDKNHWQKTLKEARVNSITCFATCHHGWAYYDTKIWKKHPELDFDLLRAQFDACKEMDINVPIYLTAGANLLAGKEHPEWMELTEDGQTAGFPLRAGFRKMCFNSPYLDLLCEQIKEVVKLFPDCDGIFLDIISQRECCCKWCMESMLERGFDPEKEEDRKAHAKSVLEKYYIKTTEAAKAYDPEMPVFHNSGHVTAGDTEKLKYFSHLELESLPTGGWGYDHFPMSAKYCQGLPHDFLGMTGKFHTTWGEFGGFKHPNALRYECAQMLAMGAKCSVGDQLHPCGKLDESSYRIIGEAYREVEEKEEWCDNVESVSDIALLAAASTKKYPERHEAADIGAGRALLEGHFLFDVIDTTCDLNKYKLLILPEDAHIDEAFKSKIDSFINNGGKLLAVGDSALNEDKTSFLWDVGASFVGKPLYEPDYILPIKELRPSFTDSPLVMYVGANRIKADKEGTSLGKIYEPYFNRSYKHFCSHQHTPNKLDASEYDSGVVNGNIMYLAHPVFSIYRWYGAVAYKDYILNAIKMFLGEDSSIELKNFPSAGRTSLMEQEGESRYAFHLLYAEKMTRGGEIQLSGGNVRAAKTIEVIEDINPICGIEASLKLDKEIKSATLEPQGKELQFEMKDGRVEFKIDRLDCHQIIVLNY